MSHNLYLNLWRYEKLLSKFFLKVNNFSSVLASYLFIYLSVITSNSLHLIAVWCTLICFYARGDVHTHLATFIGMVLEAGVCWYFSMRIRRIYIYIYIYVLIGVYPMAAMIQESLRSGRGRIYIYI